MRTQARVTERIGPTVGVVTALDDVSCEVRSGGCSCSARRSCGCCGLRSDSDPEHVLPGTPAAERPDDEPMAAVAATLLALWVPVPARCGLPTVHQECAVAR
jgi:hypothetical protein